MRGEPGRGRKGRRRKWAETSTRVCFSVVLCCTEGGLCLGVENDRVYSCFLSGTGTLEVCTRALAVVQRVFVFRVPTVANSPGFLAATGFKPEGPTSANQWAANLPFSPYFFPVLRPSKRESWTLNSCQSSPALTHTRWTHLAYCTRVSSADGPRTGLTSSTPLIRTLRQTGLASSVYVRGARSPLCDVPTFRS